LWVRPGAYHRVEHLKGARVGSGRLENSQITAVKSFIGLAPDTEMGAIRDHIHNTSFAS